MKKILQINTVYGVGSTGRIAKDIANFSMKNGMENYVAYGYGQSNDKNAIKIGAKIDYYFHNLLSRFFCMQGRFSYFATKRFLKKVKDLNPDIIHLHNIHGCYINYRLLFDYIKKNNIPVIWTLHDCWPFTGRCAYFDAIGCEKWKSHCNKCDTLHNYPSSFFIDNSAKEYYNKKESFMNVKNLTIITPSEWLKKNVKESFLKEYPVEVINNGIDLNLFKNIDTNELRKKYNLENKTILLGVANEWDYRKGLNIFERLSEELDEKYKIVLIGLSQNQIRSVNSKIIKISKTNSIEELAKWYSVADLFINPTIEDNFPTTNIEALACGTPVITYNTGGSPESLNSECGIVVEKNNYEKLKYEITNFNLKDCKKNCIKRSKDYDKDCKFMEYIDLYKKILERKEK